MPEGTQRLVGYPVDDTLVYPDAFGAFSRLEQSNISEGVSQTVIFTEAPVSHTFAFRLQSSAFRPSLSEDGSSILLEKTDGMPGESYTFSAFVLADQSGAVQGNAAYTLVQAGEGEWEITVTMDEEIFAGEDVVYPLTATASVVGPQMTTYNQNIQDTYISRASAAGAYASASSMSFGRSEYGEYQAYIWFTDFENILESCDVSGATLKLTLTLASAEDLKGTCMGVGERWDDTTLSWSDRPYIYNMGVGAPYFDDNGKYTFNVSDAVHHWYCGSMENYGFMLSSEFGSIYDCYSSEAGYAKAPKLTVYYSALYDDSGVAEGLYYISNVNSGKYLTAEGTAPNSTVVQKTFEATSAQQWYIRYVSDGFFRLWPHSNPSCRLDVQDNVDQNGQNIQIYRANEKAAQYFRIIRSGDGVYRIQAKLSRNKVIDVESASKWSGANVHLWEYVGEAQQQWRLEPVTSSEFSLSHSSLAMCVKDSVSLTARLGESPVSMERVSFSSSNTSVAYADALGRVTAVNPGTATITVRMGDAPGIYAVCTVEVKGSYSFRDKEVLEPEDYAKMIVLEAIYAKYGSENDYSGLCDELLRTMTAIRNKPQYSGQYDGYYNCSVPYKDVKTTKVRIDKCSVVTEQSIENFYDIQPTLAMLISMLPGCGPVFSTLYTLCVMAEQGDKVDISKAVLGEAVGAAVTFLETKYKILGELYRMAQEINALNQWLVPSEKSSYVVDGHRVYAGDAFVQITLEYGLGATVEVYEVWLRNDMPVVNRVSKETVHAGGQFTAWEQGRRQEWIKDGYVTEEAYRNG